MAPADPDAPSSAALAVADDWTDGVRPYGPLASLKPVAADLWIVDGPVIRMTVGPLGVPLPTRMVVVRLPSGGLWLWSPIAPTVALFEAIDALGPVEHLVSPNRFHYAGIPAWRARYPAATAWASPGVRARARAHRVDVAFDADLGDAPPPAWADAIDQLVFRGSRFVEEVAFLHRPSATLIVADLILALEPDRLRAPLRWLFRLAGGLAPGRTPRETTALAWGRRATARASYARIASWRPRRVVVAHGRGFDGDDVGGRLARAFRWVG